MRKGLTVDEFILKSIAHHGENIFDYSCVSFKTRNEKFKMTCLKNNHEFLHSVGIHFKSQKGCPVCNRKKAFFKSGKSNSLGFEEFKKRSIKLHGDKFDLSKVEYINTNTKVRIKCNKHGWQLIEPRHHLKGSGCYSCGRESFSEKIVKYPNRESLIKDLVDKHVDRYDYSIIKEKNYKLSDKISYICPIHGLKTQIISVHIKGKGCNECRFYGYTELDYVNYCKDNNILSTDYYIIKMFNECEEFYKLGITSKGVKERYGRKRNLKDYSYEEIYVKSLDTSVAWRFEESIKKDLIKFKYKPNIHFAGYTECFNMDLPIQEIIEKLNQC